MSFANLWDQLVDCICRPPRDIYGTDELIGGVQGAFSVGRFRARREDLELTNTRGAKLQCSHFLPEGVVGVDGRLPCVVYLHCNSGSRRDAEEALCVLIPLGVSVFTLDFEGSGLSDGKYVTLGAREVDDLESAVEHLRATNKVSTLGLWGRSMGAVTALLYGQRNPCIAGMVLDSPFSRLTDLMLEIVADQKLPIPKPLMKMALGAMRRSVRKRAGFDFSQVSPIDHVPCSFIPALFGHAKSDSFVSINHSELLHAAYAGDKNFIKFEGDHNSRRSDFFYNSVACFFHNTLQLDSMLVGGNPLEKELKRVFSRGEQCSSSPGPASASAARMHAKHVRRSSSSSNLTDIQSPSSTRSSTGDMNSLQQQQQQQGRPPRPPGMPVSPKLPPQPTSPTSPFEASQQQQQQQQQHQHLQQSQQQQKQQQQAQPQQRKPEPAVASITCTPRSTVVTVPGQPSQQLVAGGPPPPLASSALHSRPASVPPSSAFSVHQGGTDMQAAADAGPLPAAASRAATGVGISGAAPDAAGAGPSSRGVRDPTDLLWGDPGSTATTTPNKPPARWQAGSAAGACEPISNSLKQQLASSSFSQGRGPAAEQAQPRPPRTAEQEEAELAEAIRLSLQEMEEQKRDSDPDSRGSSSPTRLPTPPPPEPTYRNLSNSNSIPGPQSGREAMQLPRPASQRTSSRPLSPSPLSPAVRRSPPSPARPAQLAGPLVSASSSDEDVAAATAAAISEQEYRHQIEAKQAVEAAAAAEEEEMMKRALARSLLLK